MVITKLEQFLNSIKIAFTEKALISIRLLDNKTFSDQLKQVIIKPVELKAGYQLQFVYRYPTQDITKNYDIDFSLKEIESKLSTAFHQAELVTQNEIHFLSRTNNTNWKIKVKDSKNEISSFSHDKDKDRIIPLTAPFLFHLGITNESGKIKNSMHKKFKQINRFVEIISNVIDEDEQSEKFEILDMGCGKGYLSFALYNFLKEKNKVSPHVTGIELREGLVNTCNHIADKCGYEELDFKVGYIQDFKVTDLTMLIALHACNTATDEAIRKGILSDAKYIICSPCCHKQVRKSMSDQPTISSITKFGILLERQAEILTDTIRALVLEGFGYKTNVMEFISSEHTSKNLLIVAKKTKHPEKFDEAKRDEINALLRLFGIKKHHLMELMKIK